MQKLFKLPIKRISMPTMRAYIGPLVFTLFFSILIVMGTFIVHLRLPPSSLSIVLVVVSFAVLIVSIV